MGRSLSADTEWNKVIAMAVRPSTRLIVSNVTEAGLALGASDVPTDQPPLSFPGKLTQLLRERWQSSGGHDADVAIVPCELVENNGTMLRKLIDEQARAWNLSAAFWIGYDRLFISRIRWWIELWLGRRRRESWRRSGSCWDTATI
jgi:tagaturonate reductase